MKVTEMKVYKQSLLIYQLQYSLLIFKNRIVSSVIIKIVCKEIITSYVVYLS